jgi:bacterioferritin
MFGSLAGFVVPAKSLAIPACGSVFVDLCNLAISHEYGAIVQYTNHSGLIANKKVTDVLEKNLQDEIFHARKITEILVKEGATPTVAMWPPQTGRSIRNLLEKDIDGENAAIKLYQKILDLPESKKYRNYFSSFLEREKLHRSRLMELLNVVSKSR